MKKITIENIIKKGKNLNKNDQNLVRKAYEFAKKVHKRQKRKTGGSFIIHPLCTAYYITDLALGRDAICAALLHDVIEDCNIPEKILKKEFNQTVTELVKGVTKLRHTGKTKITESSVENLRRFLLVAAKDIRVLIIKLADRLHNAQTIQGLSLQRQKEYAKEIRYIYSALSDYLGIQFFKRQFDDIAFKILHPEEYKRIKDYLEKHHRARSRYIEKIIQKIKKILAANKVRGEVFGREKSIYSINKKIQKYLREGKIHSMSEYGRVYDIFGFRILVNSKGECYKVLGIIHSTWPPLSSEFEDYIANSKPNGYQSLHTTVFCDSNKLAEIQIRTKEMHEYNEYGPASHIAYVLSGEKDPLPTLAFSWLSKINLFKRLAPQKKKKDFKIKLFKKNIFVLTPANEVKQLPKGGTPVDFAYSVHTEIGNKCRGAKVNSKMVTLEHELQTGDQVEIIIDKKAKYPMSKWLEFIISPSTRARIKNALRKKEEKEAIEKGYEKLNKRLKEFGTTFKELLKNREDDINTIIYKNNAKDLDAFLARIGFDLLSIDKVIAALFPRKEQKRGKRKTTKVISIEGSTKTQSTKAKCCNPKIDDKIIALTTVSRGIRIHKANCPYVEKFDIRRILEAKWV